MHDQHQPDRLRPIDRTALPDLATAIGLAGHMRHVEVGGASCTDTGIFVATIGFFAAG